MIVENVRGAQKWVGRARWNFGSFYLWGDVPALMPVTAKAVKVGGLDWKHPDDPRHRPGQAFNTHAERNIKNNGGSWFAIALSQVGFNCANAREFGHMVEGAEYRRTADDKRQHIGKTRKFASAMIAKIPQPLARHIARTFVPLVEVPRIAVE
jgi:hypothetical protein